MNNPNAPSPFLQQPPAVQLVGAAKVSPIFDPSYAAVLDYLCKFEVPEKYRPHFDKFKPMLSQALKVANIEKPDVLRYRDMLHLIIMYYKIGLPEKAREWILMMVVELGLTQSIKGFQQHVIGTSRYVSAVEGMQAPREAPAEHRRKRFGFF